MLRTWQSPGCGMGDNRMMERKKGMLMSIITLLYLGALITIALSFSISERASPRISVTSGSRLAIIASDLGDGLMEALWGMHFVNFSRDGSFAQITITPVGVLSADIDHSKKLVDYSTIIEGIYASQNHLDIQITEKQATIRIQPWEGLLKLNHSFLDFTLNNRSNTQSLSIQVRLSTLNATSNSSPSTSGAVPVTVLVEDNLGAIVLDKTVFLDLTITNDPFNVIFVDGSFISITVGSVEDLLLRVQASELEANITSLNMQFNNPGKLMSIESIARVVLNASSEGMMLSGPLFSIKEN